MGTEAPEKRFKKRWIILIILFIAALPMMLAPIIGFGVPALPSAPSKIISIFIKDPPKGFDLYVSLEKNERQQIIWGEKTADRWGTRYKFDFKYPEAGQASVEKAVLVAKNGESIDELDLPLNSNKQITEPERLTLDLETMELSNGFPPSILKPFAVIQYLITSLLIQGIIFWFFVYEDRESWKIFLTISIVVQFIFVCFDRGTIYENFGTIAITPIVVLLGLIKSIAFIGLLREHGKLRAAFAAIATFFTPILLLSI